MRAYGMTYWETMALPMRAFWHLYQVTDRLIADEHRELLETLAASQSSEGHTQLRKVLEQRAPSPVVLTGEALAASTAVRDEDAPDLLRRLAG